MRELLRMSALAAACLSLAVAARAYRCEKPRPFAEAVKASRAVFVGKLAEVRPARAGGAKAGFRLRFEVRRSYKGGSEGSVEVTADSLGDAKFPCVVLKQGESYLVFASGIPLRTNVCTRGVGPCDRTIELSAAAEDLARLDGR